MNCFLAENVLSLEALTRCLGWVLLSEWDYLSLLLAVWFGWLGGGMTVVGWVGAGWLWSWLTDGMTVCWLCSEVSEGCLRPCVVGSMSECVVMCVVGWVGAGWLWSWLTDGMTVCWLCSEVSEAVCGWVHEWMCGYVCGGMSGSWLTVVLTDWWDDCVLTVQWVSEGCLRPCVVGSMSECVYVCGGMSGSWPTVVLTDWWDDCVLTVQWGVWGVSEAVCGWVHEWMCSYVCVGMSGSWLTVVLTDWWDDCVLTVQWGVWGRVWLGPWVNVWLCVWWDEWELADCGLDWLMGWLCVDCAVGCLRPCVVGSMSECVVGCGRVSGGCLFGWVSVWLSVCMGGGEWGV